MQAQHSQRSSQDPAFSARGIYRCTIQSLHNPAAHCRLNCRQLHVKHKGEGPKFKKQASLVEISSKTLEGELATLAANIAAIDAKLADQGNKRRAFDESRADLALQAIIRALK